MEKTVKEKILDYLKAFHVGSDNALLGNRICSVFGITSTLLRSNVNELRNEGFPVCSTSNGYFYAENAREIDLTVAHLASRAREMIRAKDGLIRSRSGFESKEVVT